MIRAIILFAVVAYAFSPATSARAQPKPDPDWPCVQRKVPTLGAGTIWSGPDPGTAGPWGADFKAAELAQKLASRRTPISEMDGLIDAFAREAGSDKNLRLTRVFAGALELINTERRRIMSGIERYARGQRAMAERIREEADKITAIKDSPATVTSKEIQELETQFAWDKRIFDERSQALQYVCETPVVLEQRLFEIARHLQARL